MARESGLWKWLSKARLEIPHVQLTRVENSLGAGFPDVDGFCGAAFQIELKSTTRPARSATPIRFALRGREAQIEYLAKRWALGGNAYFLLQVGEGPERILYLAPGSIGERLRQGLTESAIAAECTPTGVFKRCHACDVIMRAARCR